MIQLPPLSIYVHIPWCVRKCPYCDFNSHAAKDDTLPEMEYIQALLNDLDQELPRVWGRTVETVFIGGGTPSLFSPEAIEQLISGLRARLNLRPNAEITMEANPGTLEQGRFAEFRHAGINRLSIGIQSFNDDFLQSLGRIHGRKEAIRAAESAHDAGFESFNLDLMYGLPGQNIAQAMEDLNTAFDLEPPHLSWYQLTLEANTLFYAQPPTLPDDDALADMEQAGFQRMLNSGYQRYEISAWAKDKHRCQHNLNYWSFGDYLGIGAGAHGKITLPAEQCVIRNWKQKHPKDYLDGLDFIGKEHTVESQDLSFEFMLNILRLREGVPSDWFGLRTGLDQAVLASALEKARQLQLMETDPETLQSTPRGLQYLNDLQALFLEN